MNRNDPFRTPEDYFEDFNDRFMRRLSEDASNIPEKEGFVVPENYFDEVHKNILERLKSQKNPVIQLNPYKKYYYVAASIAAILLIVFGLRWNNPQEIEFSDLANSDIESYFDANEIGLDVFEIAEVIPVDELEINDILAEHFNEEKMLDYLNENIDDYESLNLNEDE